MEEILPGDIRVLVLRYLASSGCTNTALSMIEEMPMMKNLVPPGTPSMTPEEYVKLMASPSLAVSLPSILNDYELAKVKIMEIIQKYNPIGGSQSQLYFLQTQLKMVEGILANLENPVYSDICRFMMSFLENVGDINSCLPNNGIPSWGEVELSPELSEAFEDAASIIEMDDGFQLSVEMPQNYQTPWEIPEQNESIMFETTFSTEMIPMNENFYLAKPLTTAKRQSELIPKNGDRESQRVQEISLFGSQLSDSEIDDEEIVPPIKKPRETLRVKRLPGKPTNYTSKRTKRERSSEKKSPPSTSSRNIRQHVKRSKVPLRRSPRNSESQSKKIVKPEQSERNVYAPTQTPRTRSQKRTLEEKAIPISTTEIPPSTPPRSSQGLPLDLPKTPTPRYGPLETDSNSSPTPNRGFSKIYRKEMSLSYYLQPPLTPGKNLFRGAERPLDLRSPIKILVSAQVPSQSPYDVINRPKANIFVERKQANIPNNQISTQPLKKFVIPKRGPTSATAPRPTDVTQTKAYRPQQESTTNSKSKHSEVEITKINPASAPIVGPVQRFIRDHIDDLR